MAITFKLLLFQSDFSVVQKSFRESGYFYSYRNWPVIRGGGSQLPRSGFTRIGAAPAAVLIIDSITDGAAEEGWRAKRVSANKAKRPGGVGERSKQGAKPPSNPTI